MNRNNKKFIHFNNVIDETNRIIDEKIIIQNSVEIGIKSPQACMVYDDFTTNINLFALWRKVFVSMDVCEAIADFDIYRNLFVNILTITPEELYELTKPYFIELRDKIDAILKYENPVVRFLFDDGTHIDIIDKNKPSIYNVIHDLININFDNTLSFFNKYIEEASSFFNENMEKQCSRYEPKEIENKLILTVYIKANELIMSILSSDKQFNDKVYEVIFSELHGNKFLIKHEIIDNKPCYHFTYNK